MADDHVPAILEGVIPVQPEAVYADVRPVHEEVVPPVRLHVPQIRVPAMPAAFLRIRQDHVSQYHSFHVAEHLGGFHTGILHVQVAGIPDGGAGPFPEQAVFNQEAVVMPERVLSVELALHGFHAGTFFQGGLSGKNRDVFKPQMAGGEEGALPLVGSVSNRSFTHGDKVL